MEFMRQLALVTSRTGWNCVAYCLMTTHYHLVVDVDQGVLPVAMQLLNRRYARRYNRRHGLRGHAFFDRYGSSRILDGLHLLDRFTYVARNPVEAGACSNPADYRWSSYAGTVGVAELASFVDPTQIVRSAERISDDPVGALRRHIEGDATAGTWSRPLAAPARAT